jgi:hypothetical protein
VAALPVAQRAVLILRDVEGLTAAEACQLLGLSQGNQRVLLHRGRSKVRATLERYLTGFPCRAETGTRRSQRISGHQRRTRSLDGPAGHPRGGPRAGCNLGSRTKKPPMNGVWWSAQAVNVTAWSASAGVWTEYACSAYCNPATRWKAAGMARVAVWPARTRTPTLNRWS